MKIKNFLVVVFLSMAFTISAQFEIKTNTLGLATNNYNAQVELLLNDRSGIELEPSFRNTSWLLALAGSEIKNDAFRIMVSYKYYLDAEDPTSGINFGPYLRFKVAGLEDVPVELGEGYIGSTPDPEQARILNNSFIVGVNGGQKIVFDNNFVLEYYAGIGYAVYHQNTIRDNLPTDIKDFVEISTNSFTWPWDFRLGISIGYRFWR